MTTARQKVENLFDLKELQREVNELVESTNYWVEEYGAKTGYLVDLVDSHYGFFMVEKMGELIGLNVDAGDEFAHDTVESEYNEMAWELNNGLMELPKEGYFYFGYLEGDGSFGLFYSWQER